MAQASSAAIEISAQLFGQTDTEVRIYHKEWHALQTKKQCKQILLQRKEEQTCASLQEQVSKIIIIVEELFFGKVVLDLTEIY